MLALGLSVAARTGEAGPPAPAATGLQPPASPAPGALPGQPDGVTLAIQRRTPTVPGLGLRLSAALRRAAPGARLHVYGRGLPPGAVEAAGGRVTARLGDVFAAEVPATSVPALAHLATYLDLPQPLRPALDVSRREVDAVAADFGEGFEGHYRGQGVLVAAYDTGVDLAHPDLRALDGPSRVVALWDQGAAGTPPVGQRFGRLCDREALIADACPHRDTAGHGTLVLSTAASNGPKYRGVAPEADLVVATSTTFEHLIEALAWFKQVADAEERPMVVNLSLSGQEGPHDGTSLEAQALDALPQLSVVAAGNEGTLGVHALARLEKGTAAQVALRFPLLPQPTLRKAVVDIWGDVDLPLSVQVLLQRPGQEPSAATSVVSAGDEGRSELLRVGTATVGVVDLDAEAGPSPINGQGHIRVGLALEGWEDDAQGLGYVVLEIRGEGRVDLWVDTPASEAAPVRLDRDRVLNSDVQVLGDSEHSISDLACAASAVAVSAYVGRTTFTDATGAERTVGGTVGQLAAFSAHGPTVRPTDTGPKPDLAAPGLLVIAAHSKDAPEDPASQVSPLYAAAAGTSVAAPLVAGGAAVVLGAAPTLTKEALKTHLLESARQGDGVDAELDGRWGRGKLDVAEALARVAPKSSGCTCATEPGPAPVLWIGALVALGARRRRRRAG